LIGGHFFFGESEGKVYAKIQFFVLLCNFNFRFVNFRSYLLIVFSNILFQPNYYTNKLKNFTHVHKYFLLNLIYIFYIITLLNTGFTLLVLIQKFILFIFQSLNLRKK
jgi:hypothetical protein